MASLIHGKRPPYIAWRFYIMLLLFLSILPTVDAQQQNTATNQSQSQPEQLATPADFWRQVRQRDGAPNALTNRSQAMAKEAAVLINPGSELWPKLRTDKLVPYSAYALATVLILIFLFSAIKGRIRLKKPLVGVKILRFTPWQRYLHWTTAILFLVLAITGCILLFGRAGLIPLLGKSGYSQMATVAKTLHDYLGPVFAISLSVMLIKFMAGNMVNLKVDLIWLLKAGGLFGGHPSSGRYNAGEKLWYWSLIFGGIATIITGFALDFPFFGLTRQDIWQLHTIHVIAAIALSAFACGHIAMGIWVEGAITGMKTGYCDRTWAEEHHDLWLQEVEQHATHKQP